MVTRRNNRKWLWWGMGILIVGAIVATALIVAFRAMKPEATSGENVGQNQVVKPVEKEEEKKSEEKPQEEVKKEEVKQYDGEDPNESDTLTGVISYAGVNGSDLTIRVNIDQYLESGNCRLDLMQDNTSFYSKMTTIVGSVSTSTCDGFKVATSGLPKGKAVINITLESNGKRGKMVGEVNV